ncbi:Integral membrane protein SYS1-related protein [Ascosphaera apis ARSEF 7405]|uniref:Integral membrane protein SYS1-related protein n=1 Tax=Ascosphaera apis ARSEF 7405 TaxID=392613 RepID=A0A167XPF8_9EURO|nr:Integral membrane protein SYS1-related protein [Ascosphaera apis ARSEF 7405]
MPPRRPPRAGSLRDLAPLKIIKQMLLLQIAYYTCATLLFVFTTFVAGTSFSVDLLFSWRSIRGDTTMGWMYSFIWLLNDLPSIIFLLLFISRSKLVPDFALTIHLIHVVVTTLYSRSLPANLLWWGLQLISSLLMIVFGMWACQWRELQPISIGIGGGGTSQQRGNSANATAEQGQGQGQSQDDSGNGNGEGEGERGGLNEGFAFGTGRGRQRSAGEGEYEMMAGVGQAQDGNASKATV